MKEENPDREQINRYIEYSRFPYVPVGSLRQNHEAQKTIQVITQNATMITKTHNGESIHVPPKARIKIPLYYESWLRNYKKVKQHLITIRKTVTPNGENKRANELKQSRDTSITNEGKLHYSTKRKQGGRQG